MKSCSWERDSDSGGKVCGYFEEEKKEDSFRLRSSFVVLAPDLILVSFVLGRDVHGFWP